MHKLYQDKNSNVGQVSPLSRTLDITSVGAFADASGHLVRVKALSDARIRLESEEGGHGALLLEGETEYFFIPVDEKLYLMSGTINLMY